VILSRAIALSLIETIKLLESHNSHIISLFSRCKMTTLFAQVLQASRIINVVLTYWLVSISMVFFNKWLVGGYGGSNDHGEDVSIFIAWSQCVVCVIYILVYTRVGALFSTKFEVSHSPYPMS